MFSDQTGKFPRSSSKRNNYQMIFHEIYGNSNFIEPTNNRTEDEIILSWHFALARIKLQSIFPKH